ncbi:MAG: ABC transporter ATP-binding protein, partial [Actinomycetota bacterium]|nr:ABC transporter ATP-binding protein [Actinomycetota bacterium]
MPSDSEPSRTAIKVEDLSVTYRTPIERKPTLRSMVVRAGRRERTIAEIDAVKNVSFEVPRGSVLGIV